MFLSCECVYFYLNIHWNRVYKKGLIEPLAQKLSKYNMIQKQKEKIKIKKHILKQQLKDESDKEKLERLVCKRMIQRTCMHEHQKHQHVKRKGYY